MINITDILTATTKEGVISYAEQIKDTGWDETLFNSQRQSDINQWLKDKCSGGNNTGNTIDYGAGQNISITETGGTKYINALGYSYLDSYNRIAFGNSTQTNNFNECAFGRYNLSNKFRIGDRGENLNTIFSVGVGNDDDSRKNVIEIAQNSKVFIKNVGGYDGTKVIEDSRKYISSLQESLPLPKMELKFSKVVDYKKNTYEVVTYSDEINIRLVGNNIPDDLYLLIGWWNPKKRKMCYYSSLGEDKDINLVKAIKAIKLDKDFLNKYVKLPYNAYDLFNRGIRGGDNGLDNIYWNFEQGTTDLSYNYRKIHLCGGTDGNGFGTTLYFTIARCDIGDTDGDLIYVREKGETIPIHLYVKLMAYKDDNNRLGEVFNAHSGMDEKYLLFQLSRSNKPNINISEIKI